MFTQVWAAMFVRHVWAHPNGQKHATGSPYIWVKHFSSDISYMKHSSDLNLGESLCIFTSFHFPDSGLCLLNGFDFFYLFWMAWHWKPAICLHCSKSRAFTRPESFLLTCKDPSVIKIPKIVCLLFSHYDLILETAEFLVLGPCNFGETLFNTRHYEKMSTTAEFWLRPQRGVAL